MIENIQVSKEDLNKVLDILEVYGIDSHEEVPPELFPVYFKLTNMFNNMYESFKSMVMDSVMNMNDQGFVNKEEYIIGFNKFLNETLKDYDKNDEDYKTIIRGQEEAKKTLSVFLAGDDIYPHVMRSFIWEIKNNK